jgi:hypothetical protein
VTDRTVFAAMVREEWRLHSDLFGGRRFAAFPVFVAVVGGAAAWLLARTGTGAGAVVAGTHVLAFAFGLQTGSVGFVGREAMRDLLGGLTLVAFSARTLPLSRRRLLGIFLLKDALYYAVLFMFPLSVALVPVLSPGRLPALWLSLTLTFLLGLAVTLLGIALSTHGRAGRLALLAGGIALGVLFAAGVDLLAFTPYALYSDSSMASALRVLAPVVALSVLGLALYDTEYSSPARTAGNDFVAWRDRLRTDDAVFVKGLLDIHRSSGGVWKVLLSAGIVLAVGAFLVSLAGRITGVAPLPGVGLGAVLGLTAFSTYNWLTQFDDVAAYFRYPVSPAAVFRAKGRGFVLLGLPIAAVCYLGGILWEGTTLLDAAAGAVLLAGLQSYFFGVTVYLTGFDPNEFLFDVVLFAAFTIAVAVALVPVLVIGFVAGELTLALAGAVGVAGIVLGAIGVGLYRRAVPRWSERFREN